MKRKSLLLIVLMAIFAPLALNAQNTLTIPEQGVELTQNEYIPVYGYYADTDGCNSEFIVPAADLTAMRGNDITAMDFYLSTVATAAWNATFQVYLTTTMVATCWSVLTSFLVAPISALILMVMKPRKPLIIAMKDGVVLQVPFKTSSRRRLSHMKDLLPVPNLRASLPPIMVTEPPL